MIRGSFTAMRDTIWKRMFGKASVLRLALSLGLFVSAEKSAFSQPVASQERNVFDGLTTTRVVPGVPYELTGKRIAITNWHYIQPGDLDWKDAAGKSVYVSGSSGAFEATHIAVRAPRGIRLTAEKPQIMGPRERPHRMILREGSVYKGWTDSDYYESADGMQWQRKAALKVDDAIKDGLYQIFIDPSARLDERYKAVWVGEITRVQFEAFRKQRPEGWEPRALLHFGEKDSVHCLRGSISPDGIAWTTLPEPLVVEYCDSWNTAYFDAALREYVIYTRQWSVGPRAPSLPPDIRGSWTGYGRRAIGRTSSRDFRQFAPSEMILEPTPDMLPSEQLYTNCYTTVPGAPDQHLMFPTIWNGSVDDTTRIAVASSHDGRNWHWVPGGDILRTQPFGKWDGGCIWVTPDLIELPNGDWALPYLAHNFPHKYPRGQVVGNTGYAVWPKGRLFGVEAADRGEFTMQPVIAPGKSLKINAVTQRAGWVKVEVVGVKGRAMADCEPIIGDQHGTRVKWKGGNDLGIGEKKGVTLRIEMQQAKLYGVEFE